MNYLLLFNGGLEYGIEYFLIPHEAHGSEDLALVHDRYIGCEMPEEVEGALLRVNDRLAHKKEHCTIKKIACEWRKYLIKKEEFRPIALQAENIVLVECGFVP